MRVGYWGVFAVTGGHSHVLEALCQTIFVRVERVGLHVLLVVALVGGERDRVHAAHAALPALVPERRELERRLARREWGC